MAASNDLSAVSEAAIPLADSWCQTEVHEASFSYIWTIEKFSHLPAITEYVVKSVEFSAREEENPKWWSLWLYPGGKDSDAVGNVSLFLTPTTMFSNEINICVKAKFAIINSKGEKTVNATQENLIDDYSRNNCGKMNFISRADLLNKENGYLPNDKLTIFCEIKVVNTRSSCKRYNKFPEAETRLSNDLGHLLDNKEHSDVTLFVDEKELYSHKVILAARSPVFSAMFKHQLEEMKQNKVEITDVSYEVLLQMLRFIYTGEAPDLTKMAEALLVAADKYQLDDLKGLCEKALITSITEETVVQLMYLADMHKANCLKFHILEFIKANPEDVIRRMTKANADELAYYIGLKCRTP